MRVSRGFTLLELLVVLSIIALLIAILLPALGKATESARRTQCLSNNRGLNMAWQAYPADNKGALVNPSNNDETHWIVAPGRTLSDGTVISSVEQGLVAGAFWDVIQSIEGFKCPNDDSGYETTSYTISVVLGYDTQFQTGVTFFEDLDNITKTSEMFVSTEELDPRGDGRGGAMVVQKSSYLSYINADWLAPYHGDGVTRTFVDGHADFKGFENSTSKELWVRGSTIDAVNNADHNWLWNMYYPQDPI